MDHRRALVTGVRLGLTSQTAGAGLALMVGVEGALRVGRCALGLCHCAGGLAPAARRGIAMSAPVGVGSVEMLERMGQAEAPGTLGRVGQAGTARTPGPALGRHTGVALEALR